MQAYRRTEGIPQLILTSVLEVNGLPHAPDILSLKERTARIYETGDLVGPRASIYVFEEKNLLALPGIKIWIVHPTA
jgi:hypothetical protein